MDKLWGSRRRGKQVASNRLRPLRLLRKLPSVLRMGATKPKKQYPKHAPEQFFQQIDEWVAPFLAEDLSLLDDETLWEVGLPVWSERGGYAFNTNLRLSIPSGFTYAALERIVQWFTRRKELTHDLVTGLPGMYSAEVGPALWSMGQMLQAAGMDEILVTHDAAKALSIMREMSAAGPFLERFEEFLRRHGHRCPNELELLNPRWAEAPEQVLALVASYIRAAEASNPVEAEARQRQRRASAVKAVEAKLGPLRRAIFRAVLKRAQRAVTVRDNSRFAVTKLIFPLRLIYAEFGRRWREREWLLGADDVFFLTAAEIEAIVAGGVELVSPSALQARVAQRRLAYDYWLTVVPPDAIGPDGEPIVEEMGDARVLEGVAASGGRVRGRARIVQDVYEAMRLSPGDVLVTQATDPGWTPVFPLLSGIVLEIGGQLSHGAIVAREYGIPAVVNVRGALQTIRDGQMIIVDGTDGRVYLEEEPLDHEAVLLRDHVSLVCWRRKLSAAGCIARRRKM